jgi:hypothetical protein
MAPRVPSTLFPFDFPGSLDFAVLYGHLRRFTGTPRTTEIHSDTDGMLPKDNKPHLVQVRISRHFLLAALNCDPKVIF